MILLKNLINKLEKNFGVSIYGTYTSELPVEKALALATQNPCEDCLKENTLYIAQGKEEAKLWEINSSQSPILILGATASEASLNRLYVSETLNVKEVISFVKKELVLRAALSLKIEEMINAVYFGKGMAELMNLANKFLNNPVLVYDTAFSLIESCPKVEDNEVLDLISGKLCLKEEYYADMQRSGVTKHLYASSEPYVGYIGHFDYKFAFMSVRIQHAVVGYICVRATNRDFTDEDSEFLKALAKIISIELQKDSAFSQTTGQKYEYYLKEILNGYLGRTGRLEPYFLQALGKAPNYYSVAIFDFKKERSKLPREYTDQIASLFPGSMVTVFKDQLVALIPSNTTSLFSDYSESRAKTFLEFNNMRAFISYPFASIGQAHTYYRQILQLAETNVRSKLASVGPYILYEDNYLNVLFEQNMNWQLLKASVHPDIIRIIEYDQKYGSEFIATLNAYFRHNRKAEAAAKSLHIHKSTLFYRIRKIEDIFGIDLKNTDKLFTYEYSLRLLDYLTN